MSCNKFPNKCTRGIGIMSKNQAKFDLMPSHGFWSGRLNVASVENRTADKLLGNTQSVEKKVIFYYQDQADLTPILFDGTPVTHVHVASFHVYRDIKPDQAPHCEGHGADGEWKGDLYSDVKVHLNDDEPLSKDESGQYVVPEKFENLKNNIDEMHKYGIKVILMLGGAGGAFTLLLCALRKCEQHCGDGCAQWEGWASQGGELKDEEEKHLVEYFRSVISLYGFDGIDLNIEDAMCLNFDSSSPFGRPDSYKVLVRLVESFANGKEDFIVCITPLKPWMTGGGLVITWYQNLVKALADASLPVTYMNMQMYSGSVNPVTQYFGDDKFDSVVELMKQLGLSSNRAVLGQVFNSNIEGNIMTTPDGFEGALKAYEKRKDEFGGMFSWEYAHTAPYQPGGDDDPSPKASQLYWAFKVQSVL